MCSPSHCCRVIGSVFTALAEQGAALPTALSYSTTRANKSFDQVRLRDGGWSTMPKGFTVAWDDGIIFRICIYIL